MIRKYQTKRGLVPERPSYQVRGDNTKEIAGLAVPGMNARTCEFTTMLAKKWSRSFFRSGMSLRTEKVATAWPEPKTLARPDKEAVGF